MLNFMIYEVHQILHKKNNRNSEIEVSIYRLSHE